MVADIAARLQDYFFHYEKLSEVGVLEERKLETITMHSPTCPSA